MQILYGRFMIHINTVKKKKPPSMKVVSPINQKTMKRKLYFNVLDIIILLNILV